MNKSILEQLKDLNITVLQLASIHKVNRSAVYQSINGLGSREIRIDIAKRLGKKPSELWTNDAKITKHDDALYLVEVYNYEH